MNPVSRSRSAADRVHSFGALWFCRTVLHNRSARAMNTGSTARCPSRRRAGRIRGMKILLDAIERRGGCAYRWELRAGGASGDMIDVAAYYGRRVIRVRKGLYAATGEDPEVMRAWRVGGRLTCVSALAFHDDAEAPPALHIEVPANSPRLRDPDRRRRPLASDAAVVVHWARHPGPGDRRSVSAEYAEAVAAVCGVRAGAVARAAVDRAGQAAVSSASASRIV